MPKITIYGDPVEKGRMTCIGARGKVRHQVIPSNQDELKIWEGKVAAAARAAVAAGHGPYSGPVTVSLTITNHRPKTVSFTSRPWPISRSSGDIDKHERAVLDGLTTGWILSDDSIVCHVEKWQTYPDTPNVPDRLPRPGVVVRIDEIPTEG